MFEQGIKLQSKDKKHLTLQGLTFVITGSFEIKRKELELLIQDHGGKVNSSVSQKTQYVLFGQNPGSKYEKARKLKVPCLTFKEFEKLLS